MSRLENGKIYQLRCLSTGRCYIGSTILTLKERKRQHENDLKSWKKDKFYCLTSFQILEGGNYVVELIENYPCKSKRELHIRERFWIESFENVVNKYVPSRSKKEYDGLEKRKEARREYERRNKDYINRKVTCECGMDVSMHHLKQHQGRQLHATLMVRLSSANALT